MRRSLWPFALGLLLILDVALVAWAMRPGERTASEDPSPSTSTSVTSSTTSSKAPAAQADRVIVVPMSAESAWRVVTGSNCEGSVVITRSQNAGANWANGPRVPLRSVSSAAINEAGNPVLTGLDASCKPATVELTEREAKVTETAPAWAVEPTAMTTLLREGKATAKACATGRIHDLATDSNDRANVLCDGGLVRRTVDAGRTWTNVGTVKTATGISTASAVQGNRLYVASRQACGIRVASIADEARGTASECVSGTSAVKSADIAIWGRSIWGADASKGWVSSTSEPAAAAPAPAGTSSSGSSTESSFTSQESSSSSKESQSSSAPESTSSSTQPQWTPSSTQPQWTASSTRPRWTPTSTQSQWTPPPSTTETVPTQTVPTETTAGPTSTEGNAGAGGVQSSGSLVTDPVSTAENPTGQ